MVFNSLVIFVIKYVIFNTIIVLLAFTAIVMRNLIKSWEMDCVNFCFVAVLSFKFGLFFQLYASDRR